jgi:PAS domain S-box-containing protein
MLGYPAEQFSHYTDFTTLLHPEDAEPAMLAMRDHLSGLKKQYEVEYRIRTRDGGYRWFHDIGRISAYAPDGKPLKVTGLVIDITERKLAEDALLRVNQKLNVITNLTRQDLTNQLFVLKSYIEITKKNAAGQDRILEGIQKSENAIRSINEITEFTKDFQDMGAKPPKWQNVKMTMLLGLSHISIGKIQHSLETENLEIFADPLLEKVCQLLFANSVKHGDHVTRIRIWHTATPDGATIFFEDDGVGILPEMKEQIFLRGEGPRASMRSLFFVREILDITGITIKETGEPGKGARFEMVVPKGAYRLTSTS